MLIIIASSNNFNGEPALEAEVAKANVSFGRHLPPNPYCISVPGTIIWLSPIRSSRLINSVSESNSESVILVTDLLYTAFNSLKNITFVARKLLIAYLANPAFLKDVNLTLRILISEFINK